MLAGLMRRNLEETRNAFLMEGRRMLLEQGMPVSISNIRLADIAKNIGRTTGASYNIWESQEDFHRDLAIEISGESSWSEIGYLEHDVKDLVMSGGSLEDVFHLASSRYLQDVTSRREYLTFVHYWSVALDEPRVMESIRIGYDLSHESYRTVYQALLDVFELEPICPFTVDDLTVALTATTEGFLLRYSVDPTRVREGLRHPEVISQSIDWSLYGLTMSRLFRSMTRPVISQAAAHD
jgi:hypothetical protein